MSHILFFIPSLLYQPRLIVTQRILKKTTKFSIKCYKKLILKPKARSHPNKALNFMFIWKSRHFLSIQNKKTYYVKNNRFINLCCGIWTVYFDNSDCSEHNGALLRKKSKPNPKSFRNRFYFNKEVRCR